MLYLLGKWLLLAMFFGVAIRLLDDRKVMQWIRFALFVFVALAMAFAGLLLDRVAKALSAAW